LNNACCFNSIELVRDWRYLSGIDGDIFGIATAGKQGAHAIIDIPRGDAIAERGNLSCDFKSWDVAGTFGNVVTPDALQQIRVVDTGRFDFDEHFTRLWGGYLVVLYL